MNSAIDEHHVVLEEDHVIAYSKDDQYHSPAKIKEEMETFDHDDPSSNQQENQFALNIKQENDDMDVETSLDDLQSLQEDSISHTVDDESSIEDVKIKDEITIEEAKVEKYSEFEKQRLKLKCKLCDFRCTLQKYLWKHNNTVHPEENITRCFVCFKKFIGVHTLEKHIDDEHQGLGMRCNICSALYRKGQWKSHKRKCPGQLLFTCNICEDGYVRKEGLLKHLDIHSISEDLKESSISELRVKKYFNFCVICKDHKAYKSGPLRAHAKERHDGHYLQCPDCLQTFKDSGCHSIHKKKYCKVGPAREMMKDEDLVCSECSKCCQNRTALENHIRTNHPKKTYRCLECHIELPNIYALRSHRIKTHTESMNCPYCPKKYHHKISLDAHLMTHHRDNQNDPKYIRMESGMDEDHQIKHEITIEESKVQENPKHEIKGEKHSCMLCDYNGVNGRALGNHMKKYHPEDSTTMCHLCHVYFKGASLLEKHITEKHQGLGNKCAICLIHYKKGTIHKTECLGRLLFKCTSCEMLYTTKDGLLKHLDEHRIPEDLKESTLIETRIKEHFFTCEICEDDKAYRRDVHKKHIKDKHHGRYLRCPKCRITFKTDSSRRCHWRRVCKDGRNS